MRSDRVMDTVTLALKLSRLAKADTNLQQIANDAYLFIQYANRLHRYYEQACSYELTQGQQLTMDRNEAAVKAMADRYGLPVEFQRDPRGFPVRFTWPDGSSNNFGGDWGI